MSVTYTYQWQRSADGVSGWADIAGATGTFTGSPPFTQAENYLEQAADAGEYVRFEVTDGTTTWYSNVIGPIAATGGGTGVPLWDGRASTFISDFGTLPYVSGAGSTAKPQKSAVDSTYYSPNRYDAYLYAKDDIKVSTDSDFGPCYLIAPASGDHSPYNTSAPSTATYAEISRRRPVRLGVWEYFSFGLKVISMNPCDWTSYGSINYETLMYDQIELGGRYDGVNHYWVAYRHTGTIPVSPVSFDVKAMVLGQAERFVYALKQAADNTGEVQLWNKAGGGAWSMIHNEINVPTYLLGSNPPYNPVTLASLTAGTVLDKFGMYTGSRTPAPTQVVHHAGISIWDNLTEAQNAV